MQTVQKNFEGFTKEKVEKATQTLDTLTMMAHSSEEKLRHLVSSTNVIRNFSFTLPAIANAKLIFGTD